MNFKYNKVIKRINKGWLEFFNNNKDELINILDLINKDIKDGKQIFPFPRNLFRTLFYFDPTETKLVILGQDPYINFEKHNNKVVPQSCGFSFSVPKTHKYIPPSLLNIFKEIKNNYPEYIIPKHGFLGNWVKKEKILLLNSALTVIKSLSNSHQKIWMSFTDKLIKYLSDKSEHTIFLLMGCFAQNKSCLIDKNKHKIFNVTHPSPRTQGFIGCGVFRQINEYLTSKNIEPIKWSKNIEKNIN
jgi:uracil-DNA glycosylase